jgi:hypothetical protein
VPDYKNYFIVDTFFTEEYINNGFLKHDIIVSTPYGDMVAAACGRDSGYDYDFSYYENRNLRMIFLREQKGIVYNDIKIVLPAIEDMGNAFRARIEFFDNFAIRFCVALNSLIYKDVSIPEKTRLHFTSNGQIESFTIYRDWKYQGILYKDGQQFHLKNDNIIPRR